MSDAVTDIFQLSICLCFQLFQYSHFIAGPSDIALWELLDDCRQIVERIRAVDGETVLLVVDQEADKYFRDRKLVISGNMEDIEMCEAPSTNPLSAKTDSHVPGR